jgi:hypothetical protein
MTKTKSTSKQTTLDAKTKPKEVSKFDWKE